MRKVVWGVVLALGIAGAQETEAPPAEDLVPLNEHVLAVLQSYPLGGKHVYHWPKSGGWKGVTRDIVWGDRLLAKGDPQGRCYCCGLTYEVYVRALLRAGEGKPHPKISGETLAEMQLRFFGDSKQVKERRKLCQWGLESLGLGWAISELEDAKAGDFVQFWRHSGSGHQAVFVNWHYRKGQIVGLTYWSSQGSTQGIGYNTEWIGPEGIKRDEIYVGRAGYPAAK